MTHGRLFAVVGASGVGKDTIMAALAEARPELHWVRRAITRPSHEGDEPFETVSEAEFQSRLDDGAFALHWTAHGLSYGVPKTVHDVLAEGRDAITIAPAMYTFGCMLTGTILATVWARVGSHPSSAADAPE